MAYITELQLSNTLDIPIALPATDLGMGSWVTVAAVKITEPMRLTYRFATLSILSSTVDTTLIRDANKVYGNLGFVYVAMRLDYSGGPPGAAGGLDALVGNALGQFNRDITGSIVVSTPGVYSWIITNNMQPSVDDTPTIPTTTSINFRVSLSGSVRLELDSQ